MQNIFLNTHFAQIVTRRMFNDKQLVTFSTM
jgi:hypothetical protein